MEALAGAPGGSGDRTDEVVELLCLVEAGRRLHVSRMSRSTLCWFLDHAHRFRPVAFAAVGLMERIVKGGDVGLRAGVARALGSFLDVAPQRTEPMLLALARDPEAEVRSAVEDVMAVHLVRIARPDTVVERWVDAGAEPRELVARAMRRAAPRAR